MDTYLVITPGLNNQVSSVEDDDTTVVIQTVTGDTYTLPVSQNPDGSRVADASGLPANILESPQLVTPQIDSVGIWKAALAATSFSEMKARIARETLRQLEAQHFDASIIGADVTHLEPHINQLQHQLAHLEKEATNGR
jgi:hypothetical protein